MENLTMSKVYNSLTSLMHTTPLLEKINNDNKKANLLVL